MGEPSEKQGTSSSSGLHPSLANKNKLDTCNEKITAVEEIVSKLNALHDKKIHCRTTEFQGSHDTPWSDINSPTEHYAA